MNEPDHPRKPTLTLEMARRFDPICDRFEEDWLAGCRPLLEQFLGGVPQADRSALLRELLALEVDYRRRYGEQPTAAEYHLRLPEYAGLIDAVLAAQLTMDGENVANRGQQPDFGLECGETRTTHTGTVLALPAGAPPDGYEILGELGRGGMGVVYKARHLQLDRIVALKMILAGGYASAAELDRFKDEARAIARLQHPNIVQIHDVGEHGGLPYFSLEYCPGGSLDKRLAGTPLPPQQAAALVEILARAMHAAHQLGVVHRDLKPANVLLAADGTAKVTDFGLAKRLDESCRTATGEVMGTPSYMAPEQAVGQKEQVGPATDVYALGAILYECLTGRPPFKAATPLETLRQVVHDEAVPPRQLQSRTPRDLETITLKCLQKEASKRYTSAAELAKDLRHFQASEPIVARPAGRAERLWRWCRRNPGVAALTAAVALLVLMALVGTTVALVVVSEAWRHEDAARTIAENKERESRFNLYVAQMNQVQRQYEANNISRVRELLDAQMPQGANPTDFRGFEWYYWQLLVHRELLILEGDTSGGMMVSFSPDGRRLASASADQTVRVWDAATGKELLIFKGHTDPVFGVSYSPDGRQLASAGGKTARVWDAATGQELLTLKGHAYGVNGVSFSPDGRRLASASNDRTVRIWDVATGQELLTLKGHTGAVFGVSFSPDGRRLASASGDGTVRVWGTMEQEMLSFKGQTSAFAYMTVRAWNNATEQELPSFKGDRDAVKGVCFNPDNRRLASTSRDGAVRLWDAVTGQEMLTLRNKGGSVSASWIPHTVSFSPDGRILGSAYGGGIVSVWDTASGRELLTLKGHTNSVFGVSFSPNGRRLATASSDTTVRVWDATGGQELLTLKGHTEGVNAVSFSPDGRQLASGSSDNTVRTWEAATGRELLTLKGHTGAVCGVSFSPDGQRLASASGDETVRIWDTVSGKELLELKGHTGWVHSVSFSPDGRRLASTGNDQTVRIWETTTGQELLLLNGPQGQISGVSFSPDGRRLASGGSDNRVLVWEGLAVSESVWRQRELVSQVASLFEKHLLREEVMGALRQDATLNEVDRKSALELAQSHPEEPLSLNDAAWIVAKSRESGKEAYARALRQAETAVRLAPEKGANLNTLGVTQYRVGRYADALVTLTKSEKLNATKEGSIPADLAFLAMTQHKLGKKDQAKATLDRLREVMKQPRRGRDTEARSFLREAEELIEGKAGNMKP
jgi:WD40 repeat protein